MFVGTTSPKERSIFFIFQTESLSKFRLNFLYSLWDCQWERAHQEADAVLVQYSKNPGLNGYRAWWNYLMACTGVLQNNAEKAKDYHNRAISASSYKLWLDRRVFDAQVIDQNAYPPPLETQINSVISKLEDYGDRHKRFEADWKRVTDGLIAKEADYFEPALRNLGSYLGFDTDRPTGRETPDGIWRLLNYCHVFEMKTNIEDPDGSIPLGDIRQTFLHDRWVKQNRPVGPDEQIFIVLICAKKHVPQFAAHATEGITLVDPQTIVEIAERAGTLLRTTLDKLKFSNQEDAKITLASLLQELQLDCFSIHETFRQKKLTDVVN